MYDPVIAWNVIGSSCLAATVTDEKSNFGLSGLSGLSVSQKPE